MEKIHFENIIKSFFLGIFIGVLLQLFHRTDELFAYKVLAVLASGSIGFIIGLVTEWLTAVLPVHLANARMYFFINNMISLVIAAIILTILFLMTRGQLESEQAFLPVLLTVLGAITVANLFDYWMYRRAQHKLQSFKSSFERFRQEGKD